MTENQKHNSLAMLLLAAITPLYVLLHPGETRASWHSTSDIYRRLNQKR